MVLKRGKVGKHGTRYQILRDLTTSNVIVAQHTLEPLSVEPVRV
jgi:hypothetical protein